MTSQASVTAGLVDLENSDMCKRTEVITDPNDGLQQLEGLVNGGVGIKHFARHIFVLEHSLQFLGQIACFLLKLVLLLLKGS